MLKHPLARLATFLLLAAAAWGLTGPLIGVLGVAGPRAAAWFGAIYAAQLIALSALCRRLGGEHVWRVSSEVCRRRAGELMAGFVAGTALFAAVALVRGWSIGGAWHVHATPSLTGILESLGFVLCLMLAEEVLFRGYALRQFVAVSGPRVALALSAAAFGAYHLVGSGDWAMGAVFRFLMPALGGLLFGYAALRSGSLALPIGLHWGGNWVQTAVLGLGDGASTSRALWIMPLEASQQRLLAAPDVLPHLPYLLALVCGFVLVRYVLARHSDRSAVSGSTLVARRAGT